MSAAPTTMSERTRLLRSAGDARKPASFLQEHLHVTIVCGRAAPADLLNIPTIETPHA